MECVLLVASWHMLESSDYQKVHATYFLWKEVSLAGNVASCHSLSLSCRL